MAPEPSPCMASAKSASPECFASVSRSRQTARVSMVSPWPPYAVPPTPYLSQPAAPSSRTRWRQVASTSSPWLASARCLPHHASTPAASSRWRSSKNGHASALCRSILPEVLKSVSFEYWTRFRRKRAIRAFEVVRAHADGLGLRLGFDRFVDAHAPFLVQHLLGDAVREGRSSNEFSGQFRGFVEQGIGFAQAVIEAPGMTFVAACRATGEEQFGRTSLTDDARQDRARAHIAACEANTRKQERELAARGAQS